MIAFDAAATTCTARDPKSARTCSSVAAQTASKPGAKWPSSVADSAKSPPGWRSQDGNRVCPIAPQKPPQPFCRLAALPGLRRQLQLELNLGRDIALDVAELGRARGRRDRRCRADTCRCSG